MKKIIAVVATLAGVGCFLAFQLIGSEVAADGTLVEPFYLLPIGYLCMAASACVGLIGLYSQRKNRRVT